MFLIQVGLMAAHVRRNVQQGFGKEPPLFLINTNGVCKSMDPGARLLGSNPGPATYWLYNRDALLFFLCLSFLICQLS